MNVIKEYLKQISKFNCSEICSDADIIKVVGIYQTDSDTQGLPTSGSNGYLQVMANNNNEILQIWTEYKDNQRYMRQYNNLEPIGWKEWLLTDCSKYNLKTGGIAIKTGRKVNGKDEYVKRINFGNLPSSGIKAVSTGLDLGKIIMNRVDFIPRSETGDGNLIPFVSTVSLGYQISAYFRIVSNNVPNAFVIDVGTNDRSAFSTEVEIYFTCIGNYDPNEEVS